MLSWWHYNRYVNTQLNKLSCWKIWFWSLMSEERRSEEMLPSHLFGCSGLFVFSLILWNCKINSIFGIKQLNLILINQSRSHRLLLSRFKLKFFLLFCDKSFFFRFFLFVNDIFASFLLQSLACDFKTEEKFN
jgi:hypothetical protein